MRLNEIVYTDALPVDGYGPGFFRVGGDVVEGAVLVLPTGVSGWGGFDDTEALIAAEDRMDILFVGTGSEIAHIPSEFRDTLEAVAIGVEAMASPSACRTYNILLSEGRRVGLAVLPI